MKRDLDLPEMQIITIVVGENGQSIKIDLGEMDTYAAATILKKSWEIVEDLIPIPTVTFKNEIIFDINELMDQDEDY